MATETVPVSSGEAAAVTSLEAQLRKQRWLAEGLIGLDPMDLANKLFNVWALIRAIDARLQTIRDSELPNEAAELSEAFGEISRLHAMAAEGLHAAACRLMDCPMIPQRPREEAEGCNG